MRFVQLLLLVLVATAAKADGYYQYFYSCLSGVEDCSHFQIHNEGPTRTFDIAAQPADGFFYTQLAPYVDDVNTIVWEQISSNNQGQALGTLRPDLTGGRPVLMGESGGIAPIAFWAYDINNNGIILSDGIDGPFLGYPGETIMLASYMSQDILANVFHYQVTNVVKIAGINDFNQLLVGDGILSPFAVPEPSALLLLTTIMLPLAVGRASHRRRQQSPS